LLDRVDCSARPVIPRCDMRLAGAGTAKRFFNGLPPSTLDQGKT
jgi:hypothetical protein